MSVLTSISFFILCEKSFISLHSLGLASRRAEKTKPSCLDYVLIFREAARIKREGSPHMSLRDCVWGAVAEYNKTVSKDMLFKLPMIVIYCYDHISPILRFQIFPGIILQCVWLNPENWRVKDDVRRLTYNLLRCPPKLLDMIAHMYEFTKPEIAGLMLWNQTCCQTLWHVIQT